MGYVIVSDEFGKRYAKSVKIDPAFAFTFLDNHQDKDYQHDPLDSFKDFFNNAMIT